MDQFRIRLFGHVDLHKDEVWPDGDAPKSPTVEDVKRAIEESCYSLSGFLTDWNMEDGYMIHISDGAESAVWRP